MSTKAKEKFFRRMARHGNVSKAAWEAGHTPAAFYKNRNAKDENGEYKNVEFRVAWDAARAEADDVLRFEAFHRAVEGVPEPVFYQGEVCGEVLKYSDAMLGRLLQAHCPEHKDVKQINLQTPPGESVKLELSQDPKRAREIAKILLEVEGPEDDSGDTDSA